MMTKPGFEERRLELFIEEAAERYADYSNDYVPMSFGDKFNETTKRDFIAGAKWMMEQLKQQQDGSNK